MKRKILTNTLAALALLAGLVIAALCHGVLAFLAAFALAYAGLITLLSKNTDWIWNA